jgi:trk system potassium uptake protein TrkH
MIGVFVGFLLYLGGRRADMSRMRVRDVIASVAAAWITASFISAFPYWLDGAAPTFTDAFFESMSGYTTTGATIFPSLDELPRGLLTWRAITHWLGGMGIIVLTLAMLPFTSIGGFQMFSAESPGLVHEKVTPRLRQTTIALWSVYFALTTILTVCLCLMGMGFFDAINHAMATISTGGFSTHSTSVAFFKDPYVEWIITLFMFLSGANFVLYIRALRGKTLKNFFTDPEFKFYFFVVASTSLAISVALYAGGLYLSFFDALRYGAFQVTSLVTTTGFVSADYEMWPYVTKSLLFICLFLGGCAGSTSGGIKHIRLLVTGRQIARQLSRTLNPRSVLIYPIGTTTLDPAVVSSCMAFTGLYLIVFAAGTFAISLFETDLIAAISGVASALGNVGPAFGNLGPKYNFGSQAQGAKWIYSFLMMSGRLELYTVFALFSGEFWREGVIWFEEARD